MDKLITYLKNSKAELVHVSWPTRKQTIAHTAIVVVIALLVAAYIAVLDQGFTTILEDFIL